METYDLKVSQQICLDRENGILRLLEIMRRLRDPDSGCPWDVEQDFHSISAYTIEEAYEVADAIERKDWAALEGELGDLLLQTVYHAQIGFEKGLFDFDSVVQRIADKMISRHPHVFENNGVERSASEQVKEWEKEKACERSANSQHGVLDGVALALPSLKRAHKLQARAARVGFDWPAGEQVLPKVDEELRELHEAEAESDEEAVNEEFGDLLFTLVNYARHKGIDAEAALAAANRKFEARFRVMESAMAQDGTTFENTSAQVLDAYWEEAKRRSPQSNSA